MSMIRRRIGKISRNTEYLLRVLRLCFFDYDRIELYDDAHSEDEDRYDTIGDTSAGNLTIIGNLQDAHRIDDILFVVYTERVVVDENGKSGEVTRLISARLATSFERGVYYGKRN